jgi:hypothetical protein
MPASHIRIRPLATLLIALATAPTFVACTDDGSTAPAAELPVVATIEVPRSSYDLAVSSQERIPTVVRGTDNRILTGRVLQWSSANSAVARVDEQGLVTAVAPGTTIITVRHSTIERQIGVRVVGPVTTYRVSALDGRTLPINSYEERIQRDDGSWYTLIERVDSGTVSFGTSYQVHLAVSDVERYEFQGNTIERVVRRRAVRDRGLVMYNWLDGSMQLESEMVGGLIHRVDVDPEGPRVRFRIGGTNTIWTLNLRP